ncbi:MAG TPA: carbamate kinase [Acidimicrobiales bacterium]
MSTPSTRRLVVALGGHAIVPRGAAGTADEQVATIRGAMVEVANLVSEGTDVVVTHGNGPQVGNLLTKNVLARQVVPAMPLHWCVAQTQATIGLAMLTALEAELAARGIDRPVVPVLSRVLVRADDPAWRNPTKPIGRTFSAGEAAAAMADDPSQVWRDTGVAGRPAWRRIVPSPEPVRSLEAGTVEMLLRAGAVVIANGGGGVPVIEDGDGRIVGVDAVIDKDLAAAVLAMEIGADRLVILTDVEGVAVDFGGPAQTWLDRVDVAEARALAARGTFGVGSMAPKVEAAARFAEATGHPATIGPLARAHDALHGRCGTLVAPPVAVGARP